MTVPSYRFKNATATRGLIASGEGSAEFLHPILPTKMIPANGFLLILNGWNLNRRMADTVGYDGTASTAVQLLQMRAPRQALMPATSALGVGRVFGRSYFWMYRWRDSRTGEHSGLSPLPDWRIDLGTEQPSGSTTYLGQNAAFAFSVSDAPAHADTLDLFRNTSLRADVVYLVQSVTLTGVSTVQILDDLTDDELFAKEALTLSSDVVGAEPAGFSWADGLMWPVCSAWNDPVGRTVYFGMRRFGRYGPNVLQVSVTQGSDLCSVASGSIGVRVIDQGRIGQRVRLYNALTGGGVAIADPTVYRIVKVESANTFRVWPEIQTSADVAAGATASLYFSIEDDRDSRWSFISEAGKPWLIDPRKTIAAGDDYDDGVMAWFSIFGEVYCQTKRRIYWAQNYVSLDPSLSIRFVVVADEGVVGFDAGCVTPLGWAFVHETRGVRLFDGRGVTPLDRDPSPFNDFMALDQFNAFEPSMLDAVVCFYDGANHAVVVSYVPTGGSTRRESLSFSIADKDWRGPYRERIAAHGQLRGTASENVLVCGDDCGSLSVREAQALDHTPSLTGFAGTGTITSVDTKRIFTDSGASFNGDSDERLRGSPIWFANSAGTAFYFARVVDVLSSTQLELDGPPVDEDGVLATLTTGWTYGLGTIRWDLVTAYIDGGDPVHPKKAEELHLRFKRGAAATTFEAGCAEDANGTYAGQRISSTSSAAPTADVNGTVWAKMALQREGAVFQLRLRGSSRTGDPQITTALLDGVFSRGTL